MARLVASVRSDSISAIRDSSWSNLGSGTEVASDALDFGVINFGGPPVKGLCQLY